MRAGNVKNYPLRAAREDRYQLAGKRRWIT